VAGVYSKKIWSSSPPLASLTQLIYKWPATYQKHSISFDSEGGVRYPEIWSPPHFQLFYNRSGIKTLKLIYSGVVATSISKIKDMERYGGSPNGIYKHESKPPNYFIVSTYLPYLPYIISVATTYQR
jgi:hypothetical protein